MTSRDRKLLGIVAVLAVLGGFWMLWLSPQRAEVAELDVRIAAARAQVAAAASQTAPAALAGDPAGADKAAAARLARAVPTGDATSSLLFELDRAAGRSSVKLESITPSAPAASAAPGGASAAAPPAGVTEMALQLAFEGRFPDLRRFLERIHGATAVRGGQVRVAGRLLSIQAVKLTTGEAGGGQVRATVTATAYQAAGPAPPVAGAAPAGAPAATVAPVAQPTAVEAGR